MQSEQQVYIIPSDVHGFPDVEHETCIRLKQHPYLFFFLFKSNINVNEFKHISEKN